MMLTSETTMTFDGVPTHLLPLCLQCGAGGDVLCIVDHWLVTCDSVGVVTAGTAIDFAFGALNSYATSVSWNLYVVTKSSSCLYLSCSSLLRYYWYFHRYPCTERGSLLREPHRSCSPTYTLTFGALISETYVQALRSTSSSLTSLTSTSITKPELTALQFTTEPLPPPLWQVDLHVQ